MVLPFGQFAGQDVRADQRDARTPPREEGRCVRGVADERDPARRPARAEDLSGHGPVRRVTDPDDQRTRLIEPTPRGTTGADRSMRTLLGRIVDDFTRHLTTLDEG